ncbi:bnl [Drosophila busckii]|uniref:Fibroblast growth factor n=1 Tax=Drosophila busckii TaxID=30019 RepID=A0A0M3QYA6_DROBS|nr:bnl [Drosophila busckii]
MRRNLRLDWRALALLGALLSFIIAWPGLVFAMPAATISNQLTNITHSNLSYANSYNSSNKSDSRQAAVLQSEISLSINQSISAEFNIQTAINRTAAAAAATAAATVANSLGFSIAAAPHEHFAILSRTERSIRHQNQQQQQQHVQHRQQQQQQLTAAGNINFIGSKSKRLNNSRNNLHINSSNSNSNNSNNPNISNLDRNERSTISHLAGPSRKIQLYIKNRMLQLLPDGSVNGTTDEQSEYTILQRSTVDVGRIKIQSVATCLYLCMDACGAAYASKDFTDDCVFNENMELHNYNTYSSTYNSNAKRVFYLALNRHGTPRRTQIPTSRTLGKLSTYTNAITETVPQQRVEELIAKNFGANRVKHGVRQLCDTGKPLIELIDAAHFKALPHCSSSSGSSNSSSNSSSSPGQMRKLGPKAQLCKERRMQAALTGGPPPDCGKKKQHNAAAGTRAAQQKPPKAAAAKKKSTKGGRQRSQAANAAKKQQRLANKRQNNKRQRLIEPSSTSTSTTMASSLATPGSNSWEHSSPMPALALSETSDRVERNVRMSLASAEAQEDAAEDDDVDSHEDASYEDARSGAGDDSQYYDLDL